MQDGGKKELDHRSILSYKEELLLRPSYHSSGRIIGHQRKFQRKGSGFNVILDSELIGLAKSYNTHAFLD